MAFSKSSKGTRTYRRDTIGRFAAGGPSSGTSGGRGSTAGRRPNRFVKVKKGKPAGGGTWVDAGARRKQNLRRKKAQRRDIIRRARRYY